MWNKGINKNLWLNFNLDTSILYSKSEMVAKLNMKQNYGQFKEINSHDYSQIRTFLIFTVRL